MYFRFSFGKMVVTALIAGTCITTSCQSAHKATASKTVIKNELCAETWLSFPDQPHPMWAEIKGSVVFPSNTAHLVPEKYKAYKINPDTLKAFFAAFHSSKNDIGMVVPAGSDCETFKLRRSGVMSAGLQEKYPDLISLQGNGMNNKAADLRLDWDGDQMKGQIANNEHLYFIAPFASSEGLIYLIYNKDDSNETKQPFETTPPEKKPETESNKILYDR